MSSDTNELKKELSNGRQADYSKRLKTSPGNKP